MFKFRYVAFILLGMILLLASESEGQSLQETFNKYEKNKSVDFKDWQYYYADYTIGANLDQRNHYNNSGNNLLSAQANSSSESQSTSSLTVGYIADEYNLQTDNGSYKYRYKGELSSLMISSTASSFMLSYGVAGAYGNTGDIRSIAANLQVGGNPTIFDGIFGAPISAYIPIRVNLGYRNLSLLDYEDEKVNIGTAGLGAGLGAQFRIPTGLPWLEDNLTAFASLVRSVGGLGDLSGSTERRDFETQPEEVVLSGVRLTRNTDFNIEGKFERLLGGSIGVTVGMTLRWMSWMDEEADSFGQIFDVAMDNQEGVELRGTQSLIRLGINW